MVNRRGVTAPLLGREKSSWGGRKVCKWGSLRGFRCCEHRLLGILPSEGNGHVLTMDRVITSSRFPITHPVVIFSVRYEGAKEWGNTVE